MSNFNPSAFRSSIAAVFAVTVISATAWGLESYLGYLQRNSSPATAQHISAPADASQQG